MNRELWEIVFPKSRHAEDFHLILFTLIFTEKFCSYLKNESESFTVSLTRITLEKIMKSTKWNRYCSYIFYLFSILKNESFHYFKNLSIEQGESFIPHLKMNPYPGIYCKHRMKCNKFSNVWNQNFWLKHASNQGETRTNIGYGCPPNSGAFIFGQKDFRKLSFWVVTVTEPNVCALEIRISCRKTYRSYGSLFV